MDDLMIADLVGILHALFVAFVVIGQGLIMIGWARGWAWPRNLAFRALHLAAIGFVVLESWLGILCPLTAIESAYRQRAGMQGPGDSFIGGWLDRWLYFQAPSWVFTVVYSAFGALVLACFLFYPPTKRG